MAERLPAGSVSLHYAVSDTDYATIAMEPENKDAARVTVYLYKENQTGSGDISFSAGEGSDLTLPTDVYGPAYENWQEFFQEAMEAIMNGELEETLYCRAGIIWKSRFTLRLKPEPFTFTRTNVPNWVRTLLRKNTTRTTRYAPYAKRRGQHD